MNDKSLDTSSILKSYGVTIFSIGLCSVLLSGDRNHGELDWRIASMHHPQHVPEEAFPIGNVPRLVTTVTTSSGHISTVFVTDSNGKIVRVNDRFYIA